MAEDKRSSLAVAPCCQGSEERQVRRVLAPGLRRASVSGGRGLEGAAPFDACPWRVSFGRLVSLRRLLKY